MMIVRKVRNIGRYADYAQQRGALLIESLIAVLVFIIGVLAIVGIQAKMIKNVGETKLRSEAAYFANQITGQMWVDIPNLAKYDTTSADAYANRTNWVTAVTNTLPGVPSGFPKITVGANNVITIEIAWQGAGESQHNYSFSTQIQPRQGS